ncbi:MAG: hypothetical protein R3E51_15390 [Rhizobiaceae bacterium]
MATSYDADLYLPSGEISNSLWRRWRSSATKTSEMIVFIFADRDPAGYQDGGVHSVACSSEHRRCERSRQVLLSPPPRRQTSRLRDTFLAPAAEYRAPEGPYQDAGQSYEHLCSCLVGQVIGLYQPKGGAT